MCVCVLWIWGSLLLVLDFARPEHLQKVSSLRSELAFCDQSPCRRDAWRLSCKKSSRSSRSSSHLHCGSAVEKSILLVPVDRNGPALRFVLWNQQYRLGQWLIHCWPRQLTASGLQFSILLSFRSRKFVTACDSFCCRHPLGLGRLNRWKHCKGPIIRRIWQGDVDFNSNQTKLFHGSMYICTMLQ